MIAGMPTSVIPLLQDADAETLNRCMENKDVFSKRYAKGAVAHHQHDACKTLDIVLSGNLAAYALDENGSEMTLFEFRENSLIGASLLFGDNHAYPLNIYCVSDCELLHLTRRAVDDLLHGHGFVMQFIKSLSQNSQGMNRKITMIMHKNLRENILDYFQQQSVMQKTTTITLPVSKRELADYFGVQRPSLFRELKKLSDEGIITCKNRIITLHHDDSGRNDRPVATISQSKNQVPDLFFRTLN